MIYFTEFLYIISAGEEGGSILNPMYDNRHCYLDLDLIMANSLTRYFIGGIGGKEEILTLKFDPYIINCITNREFTGKMAKWFTFNFRKGVSIFNVEN